MCVFVPVAAGYILALGPLVFVSVFDVWMEKFTTRQAYIINLVSVGVVAFGCTGITVPKKKKKIIILTVDLIVRGLIILSSVVLN